jgi:hypothetical protein
MWILALLHLSYQSAFTTSAFESAKFACLYLYFEVLLININRNKYYDLFILFILLNNLSEINSSGVKPDDRKNIGRGDYADGKKGTYQRDHDSSTPD